MFLCSWLSNNKMMWTRQNKFKRFIFFGVCQKKIIIQWKCNAYVDGTTHIKNYITSSSSFWLNRTTDDQMILTWFRKCLDSFFFFGFSFYSCALANGIFPKIFEVSRSCSHDIVKMMIQDPQKWLYNRANRIRRSYTDFDFPRDF